MDHYSIYLSLGSNLGDKQKNLETALLKIEERIGEIISLSAFYITNPVGFSSQNLFVNCVCEVYTNMDILMVFAIAGKIEKEMGRQEKSKNGHYLDRLIDIDLILAGDLIINLPDLKIPHPRFRERLFVLEPLCEIEPELIDPVSGKTIRELRDKLLTE